MFFIIYAQDIETPLARRWQMPQVLTCDGDKFVALSPVHRRLRWLNVSCCTSLDLNEAQHIFIPSDQVDLTFTARGAEVAGHHHVAVLSQVEVSVFFAPSPGLLMSRTGVWGKGLVRYPIERADRGMGEATGHKNPFEPTLKF